MPPTELEQRCTCMEDHNSHLIAQCISQAAECSFGWCIRGIACHACISHTCATLKLQELPLYMSAKFRILTAAYRTLLLQNSQTRAGRISFSTCQAGLPSPPARFQSSSAALCPRTHQASAPGSGLHFPTEVCIRVWEHRMWLARATSQCDFKDGHPVTGWRRTKLRTWGRATSAAYQDINLSCIFDGLFHLSVHMKVIQTFARTTLTGMISA